MKPPGETLETIVVPIMAYSDSIHLTNFGTASLWPIYFFIKLTSKYIQAKPTSFSAHHLAYIPSVSNVFYLLKLVPTISQLPDSIQDLYKEIYGTAANSDVLTFLKHELNWSTQFGLSFLMKTSLMRIFLALSLFVLMVLRGISFHGFFTYSADYPEKYISLLPVIYVNLYIYYRIILSTIKFLRECLCPLCTCVRKKVWKSR